MLTINPLWLMLVLLASGSLIYGMGDGLSRWEFASNQMPNALSASNVPHHSPPYMRELPKLPDHSNFQESAYMADCVKPFTLDLSHEKKLDSESMYALSEKAKMIDLLLNNQITDGHHNGGPHRADVSGIYQQIEYDSGEIERLDLKQEFTLKELLTAIKTSSMSIGKMAGIISVRDLALNPSLQDSEQDGRSNGQRLGVMEAELMAYNIKDRIKKFELNRAKRLSTTTLAPSDSITTDKPNLTVWDQGKTTTTTTTAKPTTTNKSLRKRRQIQAPDTRAYLEDVSHDAIPSGIDDAMHSLASIGQPHDDRQLESMYHRRSILDDDTDIYDLDDDSRSLATLVYNGYAAHHGNRFGRDTSDQAESDVSDDSLPAGATTTITTVTKRKGKNKKSNQRKKAKQSQQDTTTTSSPDQPDENQDDGASRADPLPAASTTTSTTKKPNSSTTTKGLIKQDTSSTTTTTTGSPDKVKNESTTTKAPGSNVTIETTREPEEPVILRTERVFTVASIAGYVQGQKLAMSTLVQARSLRNESKYLDTSELGFRDGLKEGWMIGMKKPMEMAVDVWSKLRNVYNKSSLYDEERPDPYDLGAKVGYSVGTIVGYNTARKPDPSLDGPSGTLEHALRNGKPNYGAESAQKLASRRAAYEAASQAAFKASLKIGFMAGAKLGPTAGLFYARRSGARSGAKIGATLGAEAGLRAGGDTTARVALYEQAQLQSMVSPEVTNLATSTAMSCGRESGRVIGALVGALSADEGFKAYVDNSGFIEAVATEYMRYKKGAEHGYKLGHSTGMSIKINRRSPFYVDPLNKINFNAIVMTEELPTMTADMLNKMKVMNNMTIDDKDNEINGEIKYPDTMKIKLKLRAYAGDKKSDSILLKIWGTAEKTGIGGLDHIYGYLAGSLTSEDDVSAGESKLDQEDKELQILYEEARKGIMPSSRNNLKINTATGDTNSSDIDAKASYMGSIFDSESAKTNINRSQNSSKTTTTTVAPKPSQTTSTTTKTTMALQSGQTTSNTTTTTGAPKSGKGDTTKKPDSDKKESKNKKKKKKSSSTTTTTKAPK